MSEIKRHSWVLMEAESDEGTVVSIDFALFENGSVSIRENWNDQDEIWSTGITINVPKRIWGEAMIWLADAALEDKA